MLRCVCVYLYRILGTPVFQYFASILQRRWANILAAKAVFIYCLLLLETNFRLRQFMDSTIETFSHSFLVVIHTVCLHFAFMFNVQCVQCSSFMAMVYRAASYSSPYTHCRIQCSNVH